MSKLEELVQQLCPDGVEFRSLKECCVLQKGLTPIQKAIPGEYPLVVTTTERKSSNTFQFTRPTVCVPLISSRGHGVASINQLYYQEGKFALGTILCGITPLDDSKLSARFLYYYLNHKKDVLIVPLMRGGANVSLTVDALSRIKVPIPPLEVQKEIVRIFDAFDGLITQLTAELTARKKQYEYYRNRLLTFDVRREETANTIWKTLGEICSIISGFPFDSSSFCENGIRLLRGMNVKRGYLDFFENNNRYWNTADGLEKFLLNAGDIVIAMDGSLVGKSFGVVTEQNLPLLLVQRVARVRVIEGNPRYIYHCIANRFSNYVDLKKTEGAVPHISLKDISCFLVPFPNLDVQNRLAATLDNFETICSDLNIGLPAEIEARQKQYEYYRDALLTYTATGATILTDRPLRR